MLTGIEQVSALLADAAGADLVRAVLRDDDARVTSWQARKIDWGLGPGAHVYKVTGEALTGDGITPWAFVVKTFSLAGTALEAASADPHSWDYWKREWLAYRSPVLHRLRQGSGKVVI